MDVDNDHSDNPEDWITLEDVKRAFPNVAFFVHYSRNHMKDKGEGDKFKSTRPDFIYSLFYPKKSETLKNIKRSRKEY